MSNVPDVITPGADEPHVAIQMSNVHSQPPPATQLSAHDQAMAAKKKADQLAAEAEEARKEAAKWEQAHNAAVDNERLQLLSRIETASLDEEGVPEMDLRHNLSGAVIRMAGKQTEWCCVVRLLLRAVRSRFHVGDCELSE